MVDGQTMAKLGTTIPARPHMTQYPANGTTLVNADDNTRYRVAGNAPLPLAGDHHRRGHHRLADARAERDRDRRAAAPRRRARPTAPSSPPAAPSTGWPAAPRSSSPTAPCSATAPGAVTVDPATISGLGGGRLLAAPKDGTVLRGLPSNTLWEVVGGIRRQTFVNVAGVSVDDGALNGIPLPSAPPTPSAPAPVAAFAPVISTGYTVNRTGTRLTSLKVRDAPVGSKVAVACNSRSRGCPYRSKSYAVASLRTRSVLGSFRNKRLRSKAVVTVKVTSPAGAVKVMTITCALEPAARSAPTAAPRPAPSSASAEVSAFDVYISVDVEADGPIPLVHSLSSLGASVAGRYDGKAFTRADPTEQTFYAELQPISDEFDPEAAAVAGLDREALKRGGEEPVAAMTRFAEWVREVAAEGRPVFVAYPASFDWTWVSIYLAKFAPGEPVRLLGRAGHEDHVRRQGGRADRQGGQAGDAAGAAVDPPAHPQRPR